MTTAVVLSYPPVARKEYLDRLAALPPGPDVTPDLWTQVHDEIQGLLASLETEVRRSVAGIRASTGRTSGEHFFLFSYRTFSMPESTLDRVVVGVTFKPAGQFVAVEADVSGEHTGDWLSTLPSKVVANSRGDLLAAARDSAQALCQSAEVIAAALKDPSRRIE
jgi:hypothetical protein